MSQTEKAVKETERPFFCFKFQLSARPLVMKLPAYLDKETIEHLTSKIDDARFICLNANESYWRCG